MTAEFYNSARQEIKTYLERIENLIANNTANPAVSERRVVKGNSLESKKRDYETLLRHELDELDEQYIRYDSYRTSYLYALISCD